MRFLLILLFICLAPAMAVAQPRGFGPPEDGPGIPGFGKQPRIRYKLTAQDRSYAASLISQCDRNRDNIVSRTEFEQSRYANDVETWFAFDVNEDDNLTVDELAAWYAKTRTEKEEKAKKAALAKQLAAAGAKVESGDKTNASNLVKQIDRNNDRKLSKEEMAAVWGSNTSKIFTSYDSNRSGYLGTTELSKYFAAQRTQQSKLIRIHHEHELLTHQLVFSSRGRQHPMVTAANHIMQRYDTNRNNVLEENEVLSMEGAKAADYDGDGSVTVVDLFNWLQRKPASGQPPSQHWFDARDTNQDGQVSMSEYANGEAWTVAISKEFARYDHDGDGFIAKSERTVQREIRVEKVYASRDSKVIQTGVGAVSEVTVDDDFEIADLEIRLSISHMEPRLLDAYLIAPDGTRIDLFSGMETSWKGHHFKQTTLDDEAETALSKANPPFTGKFAPDGAADKEKTSLADYYGERSRGVWRLFIRASRSNRAGLLNQWAVVMVPRQEATDVGDGP